MSRMSDSASDENMLSALRSAGGLGEAMRVDGLRKENARAWVEVERLRAIEMAARRFIKEADESPRYITVKTWATPEADPYLKLRAALGCNQ